MNPQTSKQGTKITHAGGWRAWSATAYVLGAILAGAGASEALAQPANADWAKIVAAAEQEGRVLVYTTADAERTRRSVEAFEKAYPRIKFEPRRMTAGEMVPLLAQEAQLGKGADVVINTDHSWAPLANAAGHLLPLVGPESKKPEWSKWVTDGRHVVLSFHPYAIAYNPNLVKTPLKGYRDLISRIKEFDDKRLATLLPGSNTLLGWQAYLDGMGVLEGLASIRPVVYDNGLPAMQAVGAGEQSATMYAAVDTVQILKAQGTPIVWVKPEEGWTGAAAVGTVVKWTSHPNASQVVIDFLMTRDGQTVWTRDLFSPLPNISTSLGGPESIEMNPKVVEFAKDPAAAKAFREKWESLFRR